MTNANGEVRRQVRYVMDNGTEYTCNTPNDWTQRAQAHAIMGAQEMFGANPESVALESIEAGWVAPNPRHIVAVEFIGDWNPKQ